MWLETRHRTKTAHIWLESHYCNQFYEQLKIQWKYRKTFLTTYYKFCQYVYNTQKYYYAILSSFEMLRHLSYDCLSVRSFVYGNHDIENFAHLLYYRHAGWYWKCVISIWYLPHKSNENIGILGKWNLRLTPNFAFKFVYKSQYHYWKLLRSTHRIWYPAYVKWAYWSHGQMQPSIHTKFHI